MNRKIRMGMVGGGPGSFIGAAHRRAANLDGKIELVAGCFSRDPAKGAVTGAELFIDPERVYCDYKTMFEAEAKRADKIDLVSIVTPNAAHFEVAMAALDAGFDVICDKPMTTTVEQAKLLAEKGMTQYRLEQESGIQHGSMQCIMNGRNKTVTLSTVILLAKGFDMSLGEFLDDDLFLPHHLDLEQ